MPGRIARLHVRLAASLVTALLVALAVCASALASTSGDATPQPVASPSDAPLATVTCTLSRATVVFGESVTVSGTVTPAPAEGQVAVTLAGLTVATVTPDPSSGAYTATFTPKTSGAVVAASSVDAASPALRLAVKPWVRISHGALVPFLSTRYTVRVAPLRYRGVVTLRLLHRGAVVAVRRATCNDGRATMAVPFYGIGYFRLSFGFAASSGVAGRTVTTSARPAWRTLRTGSTGACVKGLLSALSRLKIRVPAIGTTLTSQCADAVVAFQKAYGLPRTYIVDYDDWARLDGAKPRRPRFTSPSVHLEVDKTRQILMVVKNGRLAGLIAVSTGATGNTPEGSFTIQRKTPWTTSLYGTDVLWRTMGFVGNFAIHGYPSVPPYPASHGCVREPWWVADWVYRQSSVGERLYIYH